MKPIEYESSDKNESPSENEGGSKVGSVGSGNDAIGVPEVAGQKEKHHPFKPKGTSITLTGCGRKDGADIVNSMDMVTFYRLMLQK